MKRYLILLLLISFCGGDSEIVIDSWSILKLDGMWKGKAEESVELSIICDVDKSKDIVGIIAQNAKQLGEDSIMIGNSFLALNEID